MPTYYDEGRVSILFLRMSVIIKGIEVSEAEVLFVGPEDGYARRVAAEIRLLLDDLRGEGVPDPSGIFRAKVVQFSDAFERAVARGKVLDLYVEEDARIGVRDFVANILKESK